MEVNFFLIRRRQARVLWTSHVSVGDRLNQCGHPWCFSSLISDRQSLSGGTSTITGDSLNQVELNLIFYLFLRETVTVGGAYRHLTGWPEFPRCLAVIRKSLSVNHPSRSGGTWRANWSFFENCSSDYCPGRRRVRSSFLGLLSVCPS